MTYEKTTWVNGDIITAEKLNKIEEGINQMIGSLPVCVTTHYDYTTSYRIIDKTYKELHDLVSNDIFVYVVITSSSDSGNSYYRLCPIVYIGPTSQSGFNVTIGTIGGGGQMYYDNYFASNENEYPKKHED